MELFTKLMVCFVSIVIVGLNCVLSLPGASSLHGPQEYCERETFEARCPEGEVIVIQRAEYGRMRKGQCVQTDYGSLGCTADVLRPMDDLCSGRRTCSFPISALHPYRACPIELMSYLVASYECVKVLECDSSLCKTGSTLRLTSSSGFLSSLVTSQTGCGGPECPWLLSPENGQSFNLTLLNFHHPTEEEAAQRLCHRYASIKDENTQVTKDVTVCGDEPRLKTFSTSESSSLEIKMYTGTVAENTTPFLIWFEAIGCPSITPPKGGHIKRNGDMMTVQCNFTQRAWHLTCDGNAWVGQVGTCYDEDIEENEHWNLESVLENAGSTPQGLLLVIAIGVALGVILGFLMLAVAMVCMKKRRRMREYERQSHMMDVAGMTSDKSDVTSFHTFGDPSSAGSKPPGDYFKTYGARGQPGGSDNVGRNNNENLPDPYCSSGLPPPPYYHQRNMTDCGGSLRSKEHTYESPNFTGQRDVTMGRDGDVLS